MIGDLRDRPGFADTVADRVWRAFWKDKGHPLSLLTGLVQESLGAETIPTTLVAHRDDVFLGTVSIIACDEESRPQYTPWIAALWVDPEHRQQGIGAALVGEAAEFAFQAGWGRAYLLSGPHRVSFYRTIGWSEIERIGPDDDEMFVLIRDAERKIPT